jgi:hypothetical protein
MVYGLGLVDSSIPKELGVLQFQSMDDLSLQTRWFFEGY